MNKTVAVFVAGFSGGVLIRSFVNFGWSFSLLFAFLGLFFSGLFYLLQPKADPPQAGKFQKPLFFIGLFLFSIGLGMVRYEFKETKSSGLENQINSKITLTGTITDEPDEKENYIRLILEVEEVPLQERDARISNQIENLEKFGKSKTKSKILVISRRYPIFRYGDRIEISGKLERPKKISEFDWPAYLAKDDIYYEMFYPQIKLLQGDGRALRSFSVGGLKRELYALKEKFIANISFIIPEPGAGYLAGLTVGAKQAMPKFLLEDFRKAGIIHVVVLSGYNVTIVANVIMAIFKFLPFYAGIGLGMLGILLFALMTGASATVVRASVMACLVLLAKATGRIYQITIALLAVGFLMIFHNPKILRFDSSFQLSFLATLALIYVSPYVEKKLSFIPKKFHLREIFSATISTQIFVLPFLLYKMGLFSVVALPVNLLVLIFVPATMFFGFLGGLAGFLSQTLALPFGWVAYALSAYELRVVDIFSKLPFAAFNISISFWLTLLIYALYIVILYKLNRKKA